MDLEQLIEDLTKPSAVPRSPAPAEVRQTHISVVFLHGDRAFKLKKPVDLGFLDYTTLEHRRRLCHAELELNRRLAPDVYLGVVPVTLEHGKAVFNGEGEIVDWAVEPFERQ